MFRKTQFYHRIVLLVVAWSGLIAAPQVFAAYKQIVAGGWHTCGLKSDGSAICWGNNAYGQSTVPNGTFTQLSAGVSHTCGLKSDGNATCWGYNMYGQSTVPSGTFTQLSVGAAYTCGLKSDGSADCWGWNPFDQTTIPSGGMFTQLSAGGSHTCGLRSNGSAICWGSNSNGQSTVPSGTFIQISAGSFHTCGLKSDGSAICWGFGNSGVPNDTFTQLSAGGQHTCGLKSDGSAVCWGLGQIGQSSVPSGTFIQLSAGSHHVCGLRSDGSAVCWGAGKTNTASQGNPLDMNWGQSIVPVDIDYQCKTNPASCGITKLDGISTNALITPTSKMITGVLISGGTKRVMVRASSVDGAVDPLLEILTYPDRKLLGGNDSWGIDPAATELTQKKLAPARPTDAATIINLPPGLFTMEVTSKNGGSGANVIEVYDMAVFP